MALLPPSLPAETPIDMPVQRFGGSPPGSMEVLTSPEGMLSRRVLLLILTLLLATAASTSVRAALLRDGEDFGDIILLLLFFPLFGWIAFGFINSAIGFAMMMLGIHPGFVPAPRSLAPLIGRTAVLIPIHNEDVEAVFDRARIMMKSVMEQGAASSFAFFVLSDSSAANEAAEQAAWAALAPTAPLPLYYRRRTENVGRKPGNIADWVARFGGGFDYMLVLDADSLMSGSAMVGMASVMDRRPSVGLLQTVPTVIGAATFFQRWMQFSSRLYGPIASAGLVWWSGSEATFWGHNALLRTQAFASSCGLPVLPGKAPFGGAIMSHDMVEAALLRRRGWAVHMIMIDESYEEFPPTMIDLAVRDRRWAQGNIQHTTLLGSSGFHWISRLQLLIGASAYITSPAWLLLILTTLVQALNGNANYIDNSPPPELLWLTILLLFGPKLMAIIWTFADDERRQAFGGGKSVLRSVAMEIPLSMLMAPVTMLTQTIDLVNIVRGQPSGWNPQNRDRDGLSFAESFPRYRWHVGLGLVFVAVAPAVPVTALWLLPVTLGLLSAPWLVSWTASKQLGQRYRERGYFCVPATALEHEAMDKEAHTTIRA